MIMKAKGGCRVSWLAAVGVVALAAAVSPAWLADGAEEAKGPDTAKETVAGWKLDLAPAESTTEQLKSPANVEFTDLHILDALEFIQDSMEVNVVLDQRVVAPHPDFERPAVLLPEIEPYASDGILQYVNLKDTPIGEILKAMVRPLSLTTQVRGEIVWISTEKQLEADKLIPLPSSTMASSPALELILFPVNIEFKDIHIRDVVEFFETAFDLKITLDDRVVMAKGEEWAAAKKALPSLATDGMIRVINIKDARLCEALHAVTRLLNLTYSVKEDHVYISTPELIDKPEVGSPAE